MTRDDMIRHAILASATMHEIAAELLHAIGKE